MAKDQLFADDKLDPAIAKAADRLLEAMKEEKAAGERKKSKSGLLMKHLRDLGKTKIRHGNTIIEIVSTPAAEKLKVKEPKQAPVKKVKTTQSKSGQTIP